jgi:hypothetical protein
MSAFRSQYRIRSVALLLGAFLLFSVRGYSQNDSLTPKKFRIGAAIDFMGIGYHGYYYPWDNYSITTSGKLILVPSRSPWLKPYVSLGLGITTFNRIGYGTLSSGILIGKGVSYCRIGGALAIAFTEHRVRWDRGIHNGGSGTSYIPWGAQVIPTLGYTYLPRNNGLTASLYISPHFALPTYTAPGSVDQEFWVSAGISLGYLF